MKENRANPNPKPQEMAGEGDCYMEKGLASPFRMGLEGRAPTHSFLIHHIAVSRFTFSSFFASLRHVAIL